MSNDIPSEPKNPTPDTEELDDSHEHQEFLFGALERLYSKDRTRYGGEPVAPKGILDIEDHDERNARLEDFLKKMEAIPLTDEEKAQEEEWRKLQLGTGTDEFLDDDIADAVIGWVEGYGERPPFLK